MAISVMSFMPESCLLKHEAIKTKQKPDNPSLPKTADKADEERNQVNPGHDQRSVK